MSTRSMSLAVNHTSSATIRTAVTQLHRPLIHRPRIWKVWVADYMPRRSPIPVLTGLDVEQPRWSRPACYRYAKPPQMHT